MTLTIKFRLRTTNFTMPMTVADQEVAGSSSVFRVTPYFAI
jgi:hypothetical protein